ncbi:MAG: M15 family metallopeptidase [Xanthobacteraceae bacterium]
MVTVAVDGLVLTRCALSADTIEGRDSGFNMPNRFPARRHVAYGLVCGFALLIAICPAWADDSYGAPPPDIRTHLDRLVHAYPDWIASADNEYVMLKNGARFAISDHRTNKSFDDLIEHPDIDDMFYVPYPAGSTPKQPTRNFDPGRVRFEPLFAAMYGDCRRSEVTPKLKTIEWLSAHNGGRVSITTVNGVDKALAAVSRELDQLPSDFMKFLIPTSGTYNCRAVAGSSVRSMHAYGAAIDLNVKYADYWRWSADPHAPTWKNRIPIEIVRTFERHGFIWGGYWYHFDTMHFEYRPELLPDEPALR